MRASPFARPPHLRSFKMSHHIGLYRPRYYTTFNTPSTGGKKSVIWTIIGLNTVVFGAWNYARMEKNPQLNNFLIRNFLFSRAQIQKHRYWTALTHAFSHINGQHFVFNMVTLYSFMTILSLNPLVSSSMLVSVVGGSAVTGAAAHYLHNNKVALGASGAVMGVGAATACLMPQVQMLFFGVVPVPMWALFSGYVLWDFFFVRDSTSTTGHAAHLGGAAFGALFYLLRLRRLGGVGGFGQLKKWIPKR